MPIFAAAVMTQKHKGLMRSSNSSNADYLFQECERSHACLQGWGEGLCVCLCVCVCQLVCQACFVNLPACGCASAALLRWKIGSGCDELTFMFCVLAWQA